MKVLNGRSGAAGLLATSVFIVTFGIASAGIFSSLAATASAIFGNAGVTLESVKVGLQLPQTADKLMEVKSSLTGQVLLAFNKSTPSIITFYVPSGLTIQNITVNLTDPKLLCPAVSVENYLTCLALNTDCMCTHGALGVHVAPRAGTLAPLQLMCLYSETETTKFGATPCDPNANCIPRLPNNTFSDAVAAFGNLIQLPFCEVLYNGIRNDECVNATKTATATFNPKVSDDCTIDYGGLHNSYYPRLCSNEDPDQDGCPQGEYGKCYLKLTNQTSIKLSETGSDNPTYFCTGLFNATADAACPASPPASPGY